MAEREFLDEADRLAGIPGWESPFGRQPDPARSAGASTIPISYEPRKLLLEFARRLLEARALSARFFPKDVFRDSMWDMMLELFIAGEEPRRICVKQLMAVSGESPTGTVRRIDRLEEVRLIRRRPDPEDNRRVLVELTESGRKAMNSMLRYLFATAPSVANIGEPATPRSFYPQDRK
jgi:DNA-binding MarR family transcriptional regulator